MIHCGSAGSAKGCRQHSSNAHGSILSSSRGARTSMMSPLVLVQQLHCLASLNRSAGAPQAQPTAAAAPVAEPATASSAHNSMRLAAHQLHQATAQSCPVLAPMLLQIVGVLLQEQLLGRVRLVSRTPVHSKHNRSSHRLQHNQRQSLEQHIP